jgi:hypothetical protein
MTSDERQPGNRRRLLWIAAVVVALVAIYTGAWFYFADRLMREAEKTVATLNKNGVQAACADMQVTGYPFSFTVSCDSLAYEDDANKIAASAGSFNAAAQVLRPLSPSANLRGPLRTSIPGMAPLWIDWDKLQADVKLWWPLPSRITLRAEGLSGQTDPADDTDPVELFSAAKAAGQLQPNGVDLDYFGSFGDLEIDPDAIDGRVLPALDADGDVSLKNGVALIGTQVQSLRGQAIEIRNLDLSSGTAHVAVSGPLSVAADGLIDADLMIRIKDPKAVAAILGGVIPEQKDAIEQSFAVLAFLGNQPSMPLKVVRGKASLGFIPLGKIKPVQ